MANNVNTIACLGGVFMYVYILQAPVIKRCKRYKGTLHVYRCHCDPYRYTVNQKIKLSIRDTEWLYLLQISFFWVHHKNSHV